MYILYIHSFLSSYQPPVRNMDDMDEGASDKELQFKAAWTVSIAHWGSVA